jgi:hypothetical protein
MASLVVAEPFPSRQTRWPTTLFGLFFFFFLDFFFKKKKVMGVFWE